MKKGIHPEYKDAVSNALAVLKLKQKVLLETCMLIYVLNAIRFLRVSRNSSMPAVVSTNSRSVLKQPVNKGNRHVIRAAA